MTKFSIVSLLSILWGITACGGEDSETLEISDQPLAGMIDGVPWTFVAGDTSAFLSEGEPNFTASLYDESIEVCGFGFPDVPRMYIAHIPRTVGDYELSFELNGTFVIDDGDIPLNRVSVVGLISVEEVNDSQIKVGMHSRIDDENEINGFFTVTICKDDDTP